MHENEFTSVYEMLENASKWEITTYPYVLWGKKRKKKKKVYSQQELQPFIHSQGKKKSQKEPPANGSHQAFGLNIHMRNTLHTKHDILSFCNRSSVLFCLKSWSIPTNSFKEFHRHCLLEEDNNINKILCALYRCAKEQGKVKCNLSQRCT